MAGEATDTQRGDCEGGCRNEASYFAGVQFCLGVCMCVFALFQWISIGSVPGGERQKTLKLTHKDPDALKKETLVVHGHTHLSP